MTFEGLKNCRTLRVVDARNYRQGNGDQRPILEERPAPQVSAGRAAKAAFGSATAHRRGLLLLTLS
jgi:hypothetical protein